ncbi:hypothetical protein ASG66_13990 [Bacillus sp. Leaf406]|nr:hypothetical protein ASG66_13990 [Bacillus sp. Leaf406]
MPFEVFSYDLEGSTRRSWLKKIRPPLRIDFNGSSEGLHYFIKKKKPAKGIFLPSACFRSYEKLP